MGQITPDTKLGRLISDCVLDEDINSILEIGTFDAMGSTKCVIDHMRSGQILYTFELYKSQYDISLNNLLSLGLKIIDNKDGITIFDNNCSTVVLANRSIVTYDEVMKSLKDHPIEFKLDVERLHHNLYFDSDMTMLLDAKMHELSGTYDLIILDGGEYSTLAEFSKILPHASKYIILDDVMCYKNRATHEMLVRDSDFTMLASLDDRNGYSLFKKNQLPNSCSDNALNIL